MNFNGGIACNEIRIDSLRLRIPIIQLELLDTSLLDTYSKLNNNTGEIEEPIERNDWKTYPLSDSTKVKMKVTKVKTSETAEDCLLILLNSKILKEQYLEGIHIDNSQYIYDEIMKLNAFKMPYDKWIYSECTDIDFKYDQVLTLKEWGEILDDAKKRTKTSKVSSSGYTQYRPTADQPYQMGLQFSVRQRATPARPFLKLYWKGGELLDNSSDFYYEHLAQAIPPDEVESIFRVETTIKDKKHAKTHGIFSTRFIDLLSLTQEQLTEVFTRHFNKHLDTKPLRRVKGNPNELTPDKRAIVKAFNQLLKLKMQPQEIIELLIEGETPKTKSTRRGIYKELYDTYLKNVDNESVEFTGRILHNLKSA